VQAGGNLLQWQMAKDPMGSFALRAECVFGRVRAKHLSRLFDPRKPIYFFATPGCQLARIGRIETSFFPGEMIVFAIALANKIRQDQAGVIAKSAAKPAYSS